MKDFQDYIITNLLAIKNSPCKAAALAFLGGILMGLTVAPVGAWFLAWIALAPLWFLVVNQKPAEKLFHFRSLLLNPALWWGLGYHGVGLFWMMGIRAMSWLGVPWLASLGIALFCWTFITFWGAFLVITWAIFTRRIFAQIPQPLIRVLIGTALWCGLENFWSSGILWWTSLAFTQSPTDLAILHLGQISGTTAVTAAIVAVNGLIAEVIQIKVNREQVEKYTINYNYLKIATGLLVSLHLIGFLLLSQPLNEDENTAFKVGIIQGNIPNTIKMFADSRQVALGNYTAGYLDLANQGVDAVLIPETALPFFLPELERSPFYQAILAKGVVAWTGAYGERDLSYTNSLFTIAGNGQVLSRYDKVKLVALGEYIPFSEILGKFISSLSPLNAEMIAGTENQVFDTPFGRAIVGICYESAFSEHFRRQTAAGGEFILTASNNAHFSAAMPAQHHAQDVMRAIESDRWAVRATNTGYSGIVDPHGRTLWISGINTYEIHAQKIYRRQSQTLYVRWGDWLAPLLLGVSFVGGLWAKFY
jgi:apolipoprotein N-acyltransferase